MNNKGFDVHITPVILCGGSGSRLWPISRKSYPKQFVPLIGEQTLFQQSAERVSGEGFADPVIVSNSDFRFIVTQQLAEVGIDPGAVLIEPAMRNTAPALLAPALIAARSNPAALMLALPSDHYIPAAERFREVVLQGVEAAAAGQIVTFGIQPRRPETGYGYLEPLPSDSDAKPLKRFDEKPDLATAEEMLAAGHYLWNAGIFLYSAETLIKAFETHAPETLDHVRRAVDEAETDLGFLRLAEEAWSACPDVSIDFAIMEKADNLSVVAFGEDWSDLGSWESVWRHSDPDAGGLAQHGNVHAIDCSDTLLRAESGSQQLVGIGLDNIVAVAMKDAVLVARKDRVQDVKTAVSLMKAQDIPQAEQFPVDYRPWGLFETLILSDRFQVKRIVVDPGASLSLQSHVHRAEHWIVVSGTARVTIDDQVKLVTENQSVYVPLGSIHRMENPGKVPMVLIEVQTGAYLGEDDIIRYEDVYSRGQGAKG